MEDMEYMMSSTSMVHHQGVPTDSGFINSVIRVAGQVEQMCRTLYLYIAAPDAVFSPERVAKTDAYIYVTGVISHIQAVKSMHSDDVMTLQQMSKDRRIELKNPMYAKYRNTFLTTWMTSAPFVAEANTDRSQKEEENGDDVILKCITLGKAVSQLTLLCNAINRFGYIHVTQVLSARGADKQAMLLDRAMRLYQYIVRASDTAMVHLAFSPILPIPPRS